jgi:hypothetical protein
MSTDNKTSKELSNRTFGLIFAAIFLLIALFPLINQGEPRNWALAITAFFVVTSLAIPKILTPLNLLWAKFGQLMHKITNPLLMGMVFFLTVLPTGIMLKLLGKDPMRRKKDPQAKSYWIKREPSKITSESFDQQF